MMAVFSMDLQYRDKEWVASCEWADGERGSMSYGYNRRLSLQARGSKPDAAVENLIALSEALLTKTTEKIREEFAKFEV